MNIKDYDFAGYDLCSPEEQAEWDAKLKKVRSEIIEEAVENAESYRTKRAEAWEKVKNWVLN